MLQEDSGLTRRAKLVLDHNWTGRYTQPGPRLYPHQWSWDSAFIAIGYAHYDQDRAMQELHHLFENQWTNGLLPQIVFNPEFDKYFPGPNFGMQSAAHTPPVTARPRAWSSRQCMPLPPCVSTSMLRTKHGHRHF